VPKLIFVPKGVVVAGPLSPSLLVPTPVPNQVFGQVWCLNAAPEAFFELGLIAGATAGVVADVVCKSVKVAKQWSVPK
jgi:hypothetical protein